LTFASRLYPKRPVIVSGEVAICSGNLAVWFLFQGRPFDLARIYTADGEFAGYYVDALESVSWRNGDADTLEPLVDLFLDLWIWPDLRVEVLDEDELAQAERQGVISRLSAATARATLNNLVTDVKSGRFPPREVVSFQLSDAELGKLASMTQ
jgi:uncharacterized protein